VGNLLTISTRNYFIVFDKDRSKKKELWFSVNFFYLKSLKKKRSSFSFVNEPFFRGEILFGLDLKNKMRPLQFNKIQKDGKLQPVDPRLFKNFLLAETNRFISFSKSARIEDKSPVLEMLKSFQFDNDKIRELVYCELCLGDKKFTLLNKGHQIVSFNDQNICSECALEIVLRQGKLSGLISGERISPKLKNFFRHMILKFKSIKKVISVFKTEFNPSANQEITLYDIEKPTPVGKKYLNQNVDDVQIPEAFMDILKKLKISTLLPIQAISIERGLLSEQKNQLIMAPTSGGKTLVGELAGISKIIRNKESKMLYLVPIVALANIRTDEFKQKYKPLNISVIKKVGESLLERKKKRNPDDLLNADVIIATYEAIDFLLRSGSKEKLGNVDTIIIDEIQVLIDIDRGFLLDGFIARLKTIFKGAQFLYLSATIGAPEKLAQKLDCELIRYNNRPVPIERHLLLCLDENSKQKYISKLVRTSFYQKSTYGFKGQSIVFSNTRKKCEGITSYLQNRGINVRAYHSGLTAEERKVIEIAFQKQKIAGVVATAALAAGVDLPARQVIFESLAMGIKWLTVAEFEQMLGRAGRLKKHDKGLAYVLIEPGKVYSPKMKVTEENVAIRLLKGKIKDYELDPNEDKSLTELLAFISMFDKGLTRENIYEYYGLLINNDYEIEPLLRKLSSIRAIRIKEDFTYRPTRLGRAIAKSFLTIEQSIDVMDKIKKREWSIIEIALELKSLRNVYLSKDVVADLSRNVNMKYFSNNLFSASVLSLMNAEHIKTKRGSYSHEFIAFISKWTKEIFNCSCKDNPYCDCGKLNLEKIILSLRTEDGLNISEICDLLKEEYKILVFKGDIIDYFENLIYSLESIKNISEGISNLASEYRTELSEILGLIAKIKQT